MGAGIASPRGTVNFKTMLEQGIGPYHDQARCRLRWHDESSVFFPPWGSCELSRNRRHGAEFGLVVARWQVFCCNMENKPCLMSEVPGQQAARLGPQRSHWPRVADLTHFFPRTCLLIGRMGRQNREPGIQNRASTKTVIKHDRVRCLANRFPARVLRLHAASSKPSWPPRSDLFAHNLVKSHADPALDLQCMAVANSTMPSCCLPCQVPKVYRLNLHSRHQYCVQYYKRRT